MAEAQMVKERRPLSGSPQQSWLKPIFVTNVEYKLQQQAKWFSRKEVGGAGILTITCHSLILYRVQSASPEQPVPDEQSEVIFQALLPLVKGISQEGNEVLLQCGSEEIYRYMQTSRTPSWSQNSHDQLFLEESYESEVLPPHEKREISVKFSSSQKCEEAQRILKNQKLYFRQACMWLSRGMPLSTLIEPVLITCLFEGKEVVRRVLCSWIGSRWIDVPFALPTQWNTILSNKDLSSNSPYIYRVYIRTPLGACVATIDVNTIRRHMYGSKAYFQIPCEPLRKEIVNCIMPDGVTESEILEDIASVRSELNTVGSSKQFALLFEEDRDQVRVWLHCSVKKIAAQRNANEKLQQIEQKLGLQKETNKRKKLGINLIQKGQKQDFRSKLSTSATRLSQIQIIFILILIISIAVTMSKVLGKRGLLGLLFSDLNAGDLSALGGILLGLFGLLQIQQMSDEIQDQKSKLDILTPRGKENDMPLMGFPKSSIDEVMYVLRLVDVEMLHGNRIPSDYEEEEVLEAGQNGIAVQTIDQVEGIEVQGEEQVQVAQLPGKLVSPRNSKSESDLANMQKVVQASQASQEMPQLFENEPAWMTADIKQRYIEGCNNNIPLAKRRLEKTWDFRKKYDVDNILKRTQPYFRLLKGAFPHGYLCRSKSNRVVYLIKFGPMKYAYDRMVENGITNEEGVLHMTFVWEYLYTVQETSTLPGGKGISILDLKGLGLFDILGRVVDFAKACMKVTSDHYPERLYRAYVINVPGFFGALWTLVSPILDENTVRRIKVLSRVSDITKQLLEEIEEEDLPVEYGGKSTRPLNDSPWEKEVFEVADRLEKLNNPLRLQ